MFLVKDAGLSLLNTHDKLDVQVVGVHYLQCPQSYCKWTPYSCLCSDHVLGDIIERVGSFVDRAPGTFPTADFRS